jgi:hypothetical protein
LVPGVHLTNLSCWRKETPYQYRYNVGIDT